MKKKTQLKLLMEYFEWHSRDNISKWEDFLNKYINNNIFITLNNLGINYYDFIIKLIKNRIFE